MGTMTLEQVRDWHRSKARACALHQRLQDEGARHEVMADAIDAAISARGEAVYQHKRKDDRIKWFDCSRETFDAMARNENDLKNFDRRILYPAPPAPQVDEAMCTRLRRALPLFCAHITRDDARAALTAALENK